MKWGIYHDQQLKIIQQKIQSKEPLTLIQQKILEQYQEKQRIEKAKV